jgi:hypothetical protein
MVPKHMVRLSSVSKHKKSVMGDSKMATRGRKQKACFLKENLGETLEIHLTGKTTKKR